MILLLEDRYRMGLLFPLIPKYTSNPFIWCHNDVLMTSESEKKNDFTDFHYKWANFQIFAKKPGKIQFWCC